MPRTPVYNPEDEYYSQQEAEKEQPTQRKLGTGEPVLLYVNTGIGRYELVDRTFESKIEARKFADENYHGTKIKALTQSEAIAEEKRLQRRRELLSKAKERIVSGVKTGVRETQIGIKKVGEKAHDYSERLERAEARRLEKAEEAEERTLEREARELEREKLRMEKEKLKLQQELQMKRIRAEREALRQTKQSQPTQAPYYPSSKPTRMDMPNIWAPTKQASIGHPTKPQYGINPPPPMTQKTPWIPTGGPAPARINPPNIWQRPTTTIQTPVKHVKRYRPKKSKRRR